MSFDGEYNEVGFWNFGVKDSLSGISTNIKHHYKKKKTLYIRAISSLMNIFVM
jgi:hypothetical protein